LAHQPLVDAVPVEAVPVEAVPVEAAGDPEERFLPESEDEGLESAPAVPDVALLAPPDVIDAAMWARHRRTIAALEQWLDAIHVARADRRT
jgi:hypothetical protein